MRNFRVWLFAALLLLIGAGLRIWNLPREAPGFDEVMSILAARRTPAEYLSFPQFDGCPPLTYIGLHAASLLGQPAAFMRLPAALAGAFAVVLLYLLMRSMLGPRAAIAGAILLAANPLHVYFSQQAQPGALATLLLICGLFFLVRSAQTNAMKYWLCFDLAAVGLLYAHTDAVFVVGAFLVLHLVHAFFFPPPHQQKRVRRSRLVGAVLANYIVIVAVSLPWLAIMRTKNPWYEERPSAMELLELLGPRLNFGMNSVMPIAAVALLVLVFILLIPPFIKAVRRADFPGFCVIAGFLLISVMPFTYSAFGRVRFSPERTGLLITPLFALLLGLALARCKVHMRTALLALLVGIYVYAIVRQGQTEDRDIWRKMATVVKEQASAKDQGGTRGDMLVFWPDYTTPMGDYYFGTKYNSMSASDFFEKLQDAPSKERVFFIISQFPDRSARLYTFPGALTHFSNAQMLWRDKLNMVVKCATPDMTGLRLWYANPQTLNIVDSTTSDTQFMFTAGDKLFAPVAAEGSQVVRNKGFHRNAPDLLYDLDGRRIIWTDSANTDLSLNVMLARGNYILKLNCSPKFSRPEEGIEINDRTVTVELRTGEQRKKQPIKDEAVVKLPFSVDTDMEVRKLPVHIQVSPVLRVGRETFGIKIYSISIDQAPEGQPVSP